VFFSEIDNQRIKVYQHHYPGHKAVGDIDFVTIDRLPSHDLLIGGSPCQDLSIARGKREGLDGDKSGLFYKFLDVVREKKPKYFMMENVASMSKDDKNEISRCLGVQPVTISSVSFTGQHRVRHYWCNFPVKPVDKEPKDGRDCIDRDQKPIVLTLDGNKMHSITFEGEKKSGEWFNNYSSKWDLIAWSRSTRYKYFPNDPKDKTMEDWIEKNPALLWKSHGLTPDNFIKISYVEQRIKINMGANTLVGGKHCARMSSRNYVRHGKFIRPVNRLECLRLQGLPDDYLDMLSDSSAYTAIGDSFTLDPIVHILNSLKEVISNE
jgi:DNA (cytosine-5)-methyltransferase 3A